MKWLFPLLLLASLAAGCGTTTKTVGAEDFLYAYRSGSMPGELSTGSVATYDGRDEKYHFLTLQSGSPSDWFVGPMSQHKLRCPLDQLPATFPGDFERLNGETGIEVGDDARLYVQDYMMKRMHKKPAPPQAPDVSDIKPMRDVPLPKDWERSGDWEMPKEQ